MPMAIHPTTHVHFYVNELCQTIHGDLVIPQRWFQTRKNEVYCMAFRVHITEVNDLLYGGYILIVYESMV